MLFSDIELFNAGIGRQFDDVHTVAQRRGDRVGVVGGGDEHHVGKIERQVDIVVDKSVVLLAVEHLEQCRGGIALVVGAELIDLVEDQQRIAGAAFADRVDDAAGHRGDIGAAVAADLSLVTHTAQGDAMALSADRLTDGGRDGGFADAGRADQTDDLPLCLIAQLADGELFDDALLDLIKTVMVAVKLFAHSLQIDILLCRRIPRELQNGVDVGLDHAGFVGADGQALQSGALLQERFFDLLGQLHIGDLLTKFVDIIEFAALAQLVADHVHLLAQVVIALALVDALLRLFHDVLLDAHNEDLVLHGVDQHLKAIGQVDGLEDHLLDLDVEHDVGRDKISQLARVACHADLEEDVGRQLGRELYVSLEGRLERTHQGDIAGGQCFVAGVAEGFDRRVQTAVVGHALDDRAAPEALDDHAGRLAVFFDDLLDTADNAHLKYIVHRGFVHACVHLSGDEDELVTFYRHIDGVFGTRAVHIKVQHHLREHDNAPKRQNR